MKKKNNLIVFIMILGILSSVLMFVTASDAYSALSDITDSVPLSAYMPYIACGIAFFAFSLGICVAINYSFKSTVSSKNSAFEPSKSKPTSNAANQIIINNDNPPADNTALKEIDIKNITPDLKRAIALTLKENRISKILLQNKLSFGYLDAENLIIRMILLGIISKEDDSGAHKLLLTEQECKDLLN